MRKQKNDFLVIFAFAILLSFLTYQYVLEELKYGLSDFNGHTYVYLSLFNKDMWVDGWMAVPYCMWHLTTMFLNKILFIPIDISAAYSACIFNIFTYFVLYWIFQKVTEFIGHSNSSLRLSVIAFCMCMVQPFHFYWLDATFADNKFLGSYSMNPIHNPTFMCMKGFSLICFFLVYDIWGRQKNINYNGVFFHVENGLKKYYIYLTIFLFLSAMAKPTFAEMFIPAVALIMLGEWITRLVKKDGSAQSYFKHCLYTLFCAVPTLLYILLQFLVYFILGGSYGNGGSLIITKWLEVWSMYTENVALSILLGMAFPLFMLLINFNYFIHSDLGRLSLVGYAVSFLEAALLGESGEKLSYSNFLWPMMSGMLFMFVTSMIRLLVLEQTQSDTKVRRLLLAISWFLFAIHVLYGLLFIIRI